MVPTLRQTRLSTDGCTLGSARSGLVVGTKLGTVGTDKSKARLRSPRFGSPSPPLALAGFGVTVRGGGRHIYGIKIDWWSRVAEVHSDCGRLLKVIRMGPFHARQARWLCCPAQIPGRGPGRSRDGPQRPQAEAHGRPGQAQPCTDRSSASILRRECLSPSGTRARPHVQFLRPEAK